MTSSTPASAIEIPHSSLGVSGLEIGNVDRTSPAFLRFRLPLMDECNYRRQLFIAVLKRRHSLVGPSVPHYRTDFFSMHVLLNNCRRHQVRTAFAPSSIASVAEAALRGEQSFTSLDLFHRGG
jgi:hypothetical protein